MPSGTVKWFSERGYGFIEQDAGGADMFVHVSDVRASGLLTLTAGNVVEFDIGANPRTGKAKAVNLQMLVETVGGDRWPGP